MLKSRIYFFKLRISAKELLAEIRTEMLLILTDFVVLHNFRLSGNHRDHRGGTENRRDQEGSVSSVVKKWIQTTKSVRIRNAVYRTNPAFPDAKKAGLLFRSFFCPIHRLK